MAVVICVSYSVVCSAAKPSLARFVAMTQGHREIICLLPNENKNNNSNNAVGLTTTAVFLILVGGERARMVVLKRWRHVSGVAVILVPRGLCSASEQSLADVAVVVIIVRVARLLLKHSK